MTGTAICSDFEFFYQQWAKRALTMDPYRPASWKKKDYKVVAADSIKDWGLDIPAAPEYGYYQEMALINGKSNTEVLSLDTVTLMYNVKDGLMDPKTGTLFVTNIMKADPTWIAKADAHWGTSTSKMYTTLKLIIEKVWMQGIYSESIPTKTWTSGFQTDEYKAFTVGDYYLGAWKDLTGFVSPVFKENYPLLS